MPFLLEIVVILLSVKLAGHLSQRLGQPSVLGQLLVGLVLGPAMLNLIHATPLITELSEIGVILLMFLAGLETNVADLKKSALPGLIVAVGGVALPFFGGWGTLAAWGYGPATAIFAGVLLVATSVSISVQTLRELGRLKGRPGVTILAAAVLDDVLGLIVLSVVLGSIGGDAAPGADGGGSLGLLLLKMALFFVVGGLAGWKLLPPIIRWFSEMKVGAPLLAVGIAAALAFAYAAELAGLAGIIGAYLAGLTLSTTDFRDRMMHAVDETASGFFVPFFFVSVGLSAQFGGMSGSFLLLVVALCTVAIITKIVGCGVGARLAGFKRPDAIAIGSGMVARGEVGLSVAAIGLERGLVEQRLYTAMVVVSLVTTLVTPLLLKAAFRAHVVSAPDQDI